MLAAKMILRKPFMIRRTLLALSTILAPLAAHAAPSIAPDTPDTFHDADSTFDYTRTSVMIPMRDGVHLHAVVLAAKSLPAGRTTAPIMLERTPYDAESMVGHGNADGAMLVRGYESTLLRAGYILAFEDVRGKDGSEGDYVNERPLHGPDNPTPIDHATDAWDTIEWLTHNVPRNNGRVGMIGTSYDGMLVAMALTHPHPALKVAIPANPVINTWMNDDDFHGGAFRMIGYDYYYEQDAARGDSGDLWRNDYDDYTTFLHAGSASGFVAQHGLEQLGFVRKLHDHPAYDGFWQAQALEAILPKTPITVPTLWIAGQWDQEDMYGAVAAFEALRPHDTHGLEHLVLGPWHHGGWASSGASLGPIQFDSSTGLWFRQSVLLPFLNAALVPGSPSANLPPVLAFQTGTNTWQHLGNWPAAKPSRALYLQSDGGLSFAAPATGPASDAYVSDPQKPIPYRLRPIRPTYAKGSTWHDWLVDDQRPFSDRTDVLTYETAPLDHAVTIAGAPVANIIAATTGTDGDFVVKLIDVYPDEDPDAPELSGYQLPIAMDILRGRYRHGFDHADPIPANQPQTYRFALPNVDHAFLPGHRIMVQIQSSWFPLYDRNPQTFVPNIFDAKPKDFRKVTINVFHAPGQASAVMLPVVP
jgi:uncharacterized protein